MNVNQLKEAIKACYHANVPLYIAGPPGVGKSSGVYQAEHELGPDFGTIELRGSTANPGEVADIKWVVDGKVMDLPQSWLPTIESVKAGIHKPKGFIFMDEMPDAVLLVQSSLQQLFLDRKLGSARLAPGWLPLGAGNRRSDKAAAGRISTALANRCIHVTVDADVDTTVQYAYKQGWNIKVPAFLRFRPSLVTTFDPSSSEVAFASGRTYEMLSKLIGIPNLDGAVRSEMILGTIGLGAGTEFIAFEKMYENLPDMKELRKTPDTYPIPDNVSIIFAIVSNLLEKIDKKGFEVGWKFVRRLDPEMRIMFCRDAMHICEDICKTKAWDEFVAKDGKYLV